MSKFIVDVTGSVVAKRHRRMIIYAKSEEDAMCIAHNKFIDAVHSSRTSQSDPTDIQTEIFKLKD